MIEDVQARIDELRWAAEDAEDAEDAEE